MNRYINLQPTDQMERVTKEDFCNRFNEIFDRCDEENIGFVITEEGTDSMVVCPAWWLSFQCDNDFGCIINSAARYALGRQTYMPGTVCNFVRRYMDILDSRTIDVMIEDISRELTHGVVQEELWTGLRNDLLNRQKDMRKWRGKNE